MLRKSISRVLLGTLILIAVPATLAEVPEPGQWFAGIYGGTYDPGPDEILDDHSIFGLRFGRMMTNRVALGASLGFVSPDSLEPLDPDLNGQLEASFTLIDLNVTYALRPKSRFGLLVGGGIGGAFISADGHIDEPGGELFFEDVTSDSLTLNVVAGAVFNVGEKFYIRPQLRMRWFEAREDDQVDQEMSLGFGIRF